MLDEKQTKKLLEEVFPYEEYFDVTKNIDDDDDTLIWVVSYRPFRAFKGISFSYDCDQAEEAAFKEEITRDKVLIKEKYKYCLFDYLEKIKRYMAGDEPRRVKHDEQPGDLPF